MEKRADLRKTCLLYAFAFLACSVFGLLAWEVMSASFPWVWADAEAERVGAATGVDPDAIRSEMTRSFERGTAGSRLLLRIFWGAVIVLQLALTLHMWAYCGKRTVSKSNRSDLQEPSQTG